MTLKTTLREHRFLVVAAGALIISSIFVLQMKIRAWESPGILRESVHSFGELVGVGYEGLIVITALFYLGLLLFFLLDQSKKIQAVIILGASILFGFFLVSEGHWVEDVYWRGNVHFMFVGIGLAMLVAGGPEVIKSDAPREFPVATNLLLGSLTIATILALFEANVRYTGEEALSISTSTILPDVFFSLLFVGTIGYFLSYSYRSDVFVVSTDPSVETAFMAELFNFTRAKRKARVWGPNAAKLNRAVVDLRFGNQLEPIRSRLHLRFRTSEPLAQWVSVITSGSTTSEVSSGDVTRLQEKYARGNRKVGFLTRPLRQILPTRTPKRGIAAHIRDADLVVLLINCQSMLEEDSRMRELLDRHRQIAEAIAAEKDVVVVGMNAAALQEKFHNSSFGSRADSLNSNEFRIFLSNEAFGEAIVGSNNVIPVYRRDKEQYPNGVEEIVERLEP